MKKILNSILFFLKDMFHDCGGMGDASRDLMDRWIKEAYLKTNTI